jgi:hypothetical protein
MAHWLEAGQSGNPGAVLRLRLRSEDMARNCGPWPSSDSSLLVQTDDSPRLVLSGQRNYPEYRDDPSLILSKSQPHCPLRIERGLDSARAKLRTAACVEKSGKYNVKMMVAGTGTCGLAGLFAGVICPDMSYQ